MYVLLEKQKYFACGLKIPDQVGNDSWGGLVRTSIKVEYRRKPDPTSMDTGFYPLVRRFIKDYNFLIVSSAVILRAGCSLGGLKNEPSISPVFYSGKPFVNAISYRGPIRQPKKCTGGHEKAV